MTLDWRREAPELTVLEGEPMAGHTTFRIGGPARWLVVPKSGEEAARALALCGRAGITPVFLGNGSNLLVADEGYDGVVLSTAGLRQLEVLPAHEGEKRLYAQGGVLLSQLAALALREGATGLEFAQGIPGSVGGGIRMNAGAYGGELAGVTEWVDALDAHGRALRLTAGECNFGYRHSRFCEEPLLVVGAAFRLTPGEPEAIRAKMAELAQRRREKQPLEYPSAGSTFKRPPGHFAAALIDECGLKGLRVGDAEVSTKHAGFVVNRGKATAREVRALIRRVQEEVWRRTGVALEPEVEFLGEKEDE